MLENMLEKNNLRANYAQNISIFTKLSFQLGPFFSSILSLSFLVTLAIKDFFDDECGIQLVISSKSLDRCGGQASFWAIKRQPKACVVNVRRAL